MDRPTIPRQQLVRSSTVGAGVTLMALLLVMVNYLGWKYHKRLDWTQSELYSLSGKSQRVLQELDRDIEAVVFMTPASQLYDAVSELLARYEAQSQRFTVRFIDPERNPAEAQQLVEKYEVASLSTVVFDTGEARRVIDEADLAEFDFSGLQMGQEAQMTEFKGEQLFTGAIIELVENRKPRILFLEGHGEVPLDDYSGRGLSQARDLLGQDNFEIEPWSSLGQPAVPEGTDLVVIPGPRTGLLPPELEVLGEYLTAGGRILLLLDPTLKETGLEDTGFGEWLARYGLRLGEDIVVDRDNPLPFFSAETFFANSYLNHPVTAALQEANYPVVFSLARSVSRGEDLAGVQVTELVQTTSGAWGETNLVDLDQVQKDEDDVPGPVSLGAAVELEAAGGDGADGEPDAGDAEETDALDATAEEGESETTPDAAVQGPRGGRLVVFGDSDFITNAQLANAGNPTLLLNTLNWLVEREKLLGIPPKKAEQVRLNLTRGQLSGVYWSSLILLPGLGGLLGLMVYFKRRR